MKYEYECLSCGWKGERICRMVDRDALRCEEFIWCTDTLDPNVEGGHVHTCAHVCGGKLRREEISLTSKMANQWSRWTGHTD